MLVECHLRMEPNARSSDTHVLSRVPPPHIVTGRFRHSFKDLGLDETRRSAS